MVLAQPKGTLPRLSPKCHREATTRRACAGLPVAGDLWQASTLGCMRDLCCVFDPTCPGRQVRVAATTAKTVGLVRERESLRRIRTITITAQQVAPTSL